MSNTTTNDTAERLTTGIDGLDEILHGGLIPGRTYMLRGAPGTGKSILGLHYLSAGVENDDNALYINLEEAEDDIRQNAASLGFDMDDIAFLDLTPGSEAFSETGAETYDVFDPSEVDKAPLIEAIVERVDEHAPDRVLIDPITQFRALSPDEFQFRKQILGLSEFFSERDATVLFTSQGPTGQTDDVLEYIADGTIGLVHDDTGRMISVPKFRGSGTISGPHSLRIGDTGMAVHPRLIPGEHSQPFTGEDISSGVPELDELLAGGLTRGTATIISGPTGAGKTTTGAQFMKEAAGRGERSVIYLFEESRSTFLHRLKAINIPVDEMVEKGSLVAEEIEPLDMTPQEFARRVRTQVEEEDTQIVMIDGIDGYKLALQGDDTDLVRELHALTRYLKNMGITVIHVDETSAVTGDFEVTSQNISYLADTIVFLRHVEFSGELRKVIGVLKKRTSGFERTLREFEITSFGIKVGEPLTGVRGIMEGAPEWDASERNQGSRDERE